MCMSRWDRIHKCQATFSSSPPSCEPHPLQMHPLFQLRLLSSAAGVRRALALVESVNNVHHPKRSADPAPRPPSGGQAGGRGEMESPPPSVSSIATFLPWGRA